MTKLVNIKNQDGLTKILDMVPDFLNKFTDSKKSEVVLSEEKEEKKTEDKTEEEKKEI